MALRRPAVAHTADGGRRHCLERRDRGNGPDAKLRSIADGQFVCWSRRGGVCHDLPGIVLGLFSAFHQRGRAFSVFYVAIPVGAAAGYVLGGAIEASLGWRAAFYIVGLPGVVMSLLALTMPDPPRGTTEDVPQLKDLESGISPIRGLFNERSLPGGAVSGSVAYTFALGGLQLWIPKFLSEVRGLELDRADFIVGALTVVAGLAGTFVGGYLGDRLSARMKSGQLWLSAISSLAAIVPMWFALTLSSMRAYLTWFFIAEFFLIPLYRSHKCRHCQRCSGRPSGAGDGGQHFCNSPVRGRDLAADCRLAGRYQQPGAGRVDYAGSRGDFRIDLGGDCLGRPGLILGSKHGPTHSDGADTCVHCGFDGAQLRDHSTAYECGMDQATPARLPG